jgi:hypothetical protein
MITRSKSHKNENQDSNLEASISVNSTINNSDLINLNISDSINSYLNKTFVEKEITMAATLSFGDAMKAIPNFVGRSEGLLTIFINKCEFMLRHIDDSMKPIILDVIVTQLMDKASKAVRRNYLLGGINNSFTSKFLGKLILFNIYKNN